MMWRTAAVCVALCTAAYASAAWLTHDFQAWTAEDARRLEVALAPAPVPPVPVEGPGVAAADLRHVLAEGRGVTLVEFFYTHCETVCLAQGGSFQQMQRALQSAPADVRLLSISFDPRRDTPADLRAYAARMQASPDVWRFVRVPDAAATERLLQALQVVVVPTSHGDFEHNAAILVIDRAGRLVRIFDLAQQQLALDYARHLAEGSAQ